MHKPFFLFFVLSFFFNINAADAQKRRLNDSRIKVDPQLESIWYADGNGNEITEDGNYQIEVGAELQLIIQANKDADGELATLDMEEESCTYKLISNDYKMVNGFIDNIVLNGDSYNSQKPNRKLNNLTSLKFIGIEETEQCLEAYNQEVKKREKRTWCKKRSWPQRSYNTSEVQRCR